MPSRSTSTHGLHAGGCFEFYIIDFRPGIATLQITGKNTSIFQDEAGGHRWQRIPPTERYGRVQTSTITVAVLKEPSEKEFFLLEKDLLIQTCRGSGKGGQHRNKTETAVVCTHIPTKTTVRIEDGRSQYQNKETAKKVLRAMLYRQQQERLEREQERLRRSQIGSGMRGDKRRTVRVQHGVVEDHRTGRTWRYDDYRAGNWF